MAVLVCVVGAARAQGDSPYMRVVDADSATVRLDIAVRTLAPAGHEGPLVNLVGAIHIADGSFYDAVQAFLDVHDVVLYEGVGGGREAGGGGGRERVAEPEGEEGAAIETERRIRFLSMLAEEQRGRNGGYPRSARELLESAGELETLAAASLRDGWGRPLEIEAGKGFEVVSLGADGAEGGEGLDADVRASEVLAGARVVTTAGEVDGLQRDLAEALGLVFQLDGIDYSRPHWRNSDLSIGQIQEALGGPRAELEPGEGVERGPLDPDAPEELKAADMLFQTLSGDSLLAKVSGFLLKMVGSSPSGRAMVKVMLADMLTHAEDLLAMQPGALADVMKVLVEDRNDAVVRDLRAVIDEEPEHGTIAIFYGAGHFGDLERRIEDELDYRHVGTLWIPAMTIDLEEAGLSVAQLKLFRSMMSEMIESQMRALRDAQD
jgi:hypothetical protein